MRRHNLALFNNYAQERFSTLREKNKSENNYAAKNQRAVIEKLYSALKFRTVEDFLRISKNKLKKYGGAALLSYPSTKYSQTIKDLFPNYPWEEMSKKIVKNKIK